MDCSSVGVVAEVKGGKVEEINDKDDFRPEEVTTNEEHDPAELEEIVEDEVASNTGSGLNMIAILGEEVPHVSDLGKEESEPVERSHQSVQGKRSRKSLVLTPDGISPMLLIIVGVGEGIVDTGDDDQDVTENSQDFVSPDGLNIVGFAFSEGVCLSEASHGA